MLTGLTNKLLFHLQLIFCLLILNGCTRMCLGYKELGSKNLPIEFYIDGSLSLSRSEIAQNNFEHCLEKQTGYKVDINYTTDQKSLVNLLAKETAQFGLMSALSYVEAAESTDTTSIMLLSQNGQSSNRSVIIGKTSFWNDNKDLALLNNSTIAYSSSERDVGFLVPRMFFLQNNILPESAIFLENYALVLQSISENKALAGAVSESFLEERFHSKSSLKAGNKFNEYSVLAITQELPRNVIVENQNLSGLFSNVIEQGFEECSHSEKKDFKKLFSADGVITSNEQDFTFARELYHFQKDNVRVLTPSTATSLRAIFE